jgi:hypothetical protein
MDIFQLFFQIIYGYLSTVDHLTVILILSIIEPGYFGLHHNVGFLFRNNYFPMFSLTF